MVLLRSIKCNLSAVSIHVLLSIHFSLCKSCLFSPTSNGWVRYTTYFTHCVLQYGGDVTRKNKLLKQQAEGKKKMRMIGNVEIPKDTFISVLKK